MKRSDSWRATGIAISSVLLLGAQLTGASDGMKFPNFEPLMRVRATGEKSFTPAIPGRVDSIAYVITQTDLDSFGPANKRYDRSSTLRPLIVRSMVPAFDLAASLRGVDQNGNFTWDVFGYPRELPGVYRDEWEAFNDLPPTHRECDPPVRMVRVVELAYPGTPRKSFPPAEPPDKIQVLRDKSVDDVALSKELRESLENALPAKERLVLRDGKEVEIALDTLPEPSRKVAERYIQVRWSRGWGDLQDALTLDRKVPIRLWLSPASFELANVNGRLPNRRAPHLVGINGMLTDGRGVFF